MYTPSETRYQDMPYRRCGQSGLKLPAISLGMWHNFGEQTLLDTSRQMMLRAFDLGIVHFDLANNYGPPAGSAEETFGHVLHSDLHAHRNELVISTKAGYTMWPGPYGDWGSRKYLLTSLEASLKRMRLDYVDIFYHHRHDPLTPMEETMGALASAVQQGKALYVGISNYGPEETRRAAALLKEMGVRLLVNQPPYNMIRRTMDDGLSQALEEVGAGAAVFSPLAQGILTSRYLDGIPSDSRAASPAPFLRPEQLTDELMEKVRKLNAVAQERGQTLAQMALCWNLRLDTVATVLVGASRVAQIEENVQAVLSAKPFDQEELRRIEAILTES